MYCNECGKPNPDQAKFCAFCGVRLLAPGEGAEASAPKPEPKPQPKPEPKPAPGPELVKPQKPAEKPDPHQMFRRPADGPNVRPLVENPAQPASGAPRPAAAEPKPEAPKPEPAPKTDSAPKPTIPLTHRPPAGKAVTSTGAELTPPARAPNVRNPARHQDVSHRKPTASPFKQAQMAGKLQGRRASGDDDLFFEDIDASDDFVDDMGEDRLSKHIKSIIALLFLVLVVGMGIWLFGTSGGAVFRAQFNLGASAEAYKLLGDQSMQQGETIRAAEAYFNALKLDPDNYQYSLLVGQTAELVGKRDRAIQAYQKCMDLRDNQPEPYRLLAELWERQGSPEAGAQVRRKGYEHTGDPSLIEGLNQRGSGEPAEGQTGEPGAVG